VGDPQPYHESDFESSEAIADCSESRRPSRPSASGSTWCFSFRQDSRVKPHSAFKMGQAARQIRCLAHSTGNPFTSAGSVSPSGCRTSVVASTISGERSVSRSTRQLACLSVGDAASYDIIYGEVMMRLLSRLFGRRKDDPAPSSRSTPELDLRAQVDALPRPSDPELQPAPRQRRSACVRWREGSYPMEIVGESHYQDSLIAICGRHTRYGSDMQFEAEIALDPSNPHDPNAVVVRIDGRKVGYLPRTGNPRRRPNERGGSRCRHLRCARPRRVADEPV
jgi:hypothetical protein